MRGALRALEQRLVYKVCVCVCVSRGDGTGTLNAHPWIPQRFMDVIILIRQRRRKESIIWSDHIWVRQLKSQRGLYTNSPDPKREEENSHCFRMCGSILSCFFCIFLQYLYMLSCCSWPRPLCIKRASEIGMFIGGALMSPRTQITKSLVIPFRNLWTSLSTEQNTWISLWSSCQPSQLSLEESALLPHPRRDDRSRTQTKKNVAFTDCSRGQTSADILPGPTWNVFDTSPRFITAFAAVHACVCFAYVCVFVFCVCQATARTPVLVGGSEGSL